MPKSAQRLIGLDSTTSMDPPAMKSGKIEQVEIRARITATHVIQIVTTKSEKIPMYRARAHGVSLLTYSLSICLRPNIIDMPCSLNPIEP